MISTRRRVIAQTAQETGWSLEVAEARGLSPMQQGVLQTVGRGDGLTESQREVVDTLAAYQLLVRAADGRWGLTEHGQRILACI